MNKDKDRNDMDIFTELKEILTELLDIEDRDITPDTYLIKDLGAESIDLLELAVAINSRFKIPVRDDEIFLTRFRQYLAEAEVQGADCVAYVAGYYLFLTEDRVDEIASQVSEGPQLKIKDVMAYITYHLERV
jgi:acyl carrier protein